MAMVTLFPCNPDDVWLQGSAQEAMRKVITAGVRVSVRFRVRLCANKDRG